jgi:hypothetical protein
MFALPVPKIFIVIDAITGTSTDRFASKNPFTYLLYNSNSNFDIMITTECGTENNRTLLDGPSYAAVSFPVFTSRGTVVPPDKEFSCQQFI